LQGMAAAKDSDGFCLPRLLLIVFCRSAVRGEQVRRKEQPENGVVGYVEVV